MQYRSFGGTGYKVSALGLGCMRLPFVDEEDRTKGVDREKAYELIRYAADNGVNYFDTAFSYHAKDSEAVLGEALAEKGRRQDAIITTKLPFSAMAKQKHIRENLEDTLKKLRTDYIDFYLVHCIMEFNWEGIKRRKIFEEFEKFKAEGLIKHIGFSYHGKFPLFKEVLESYPWEMCLIQQNILDTNREVTEQGIYAAHKKGIAISIMEPLRGGGLCRAPKGVAALYDNFTVKRTPTEWAFRHLVNYPEVENIVSGMTTLDQLKENIGLFNQPDMIPGCLDPDEKSLINAAREAYDSIVSIPCTGCDYCVPCPQKVDIPGIFDKYNEGNRFEFFDQARRSYMFTRRARAGASGCNNCGKCKPKCPQEIDIPKALEVAHKELDGWEE